MRLLCGTFLVAALAAAAPAGEMTSLRMDADAALALDPAAAVWQAAPQVEISAGRRGEPMPAHRTIVRSRWTEKYLYLLYECHYQKLSLKPNPNPNTETYKLWDWDVAEAFIGADFEHIRHYTEYEVSPQNEWVDLEIERGNPNAGGIRWDSKFEHAARIDEATHTWYAAMKIPFAAMGLNAPPKQLRINLYRIEGAEPERKYLAWQPVHSDSFHVAEAFGRMILK